MAAQCPRCLELDEELLELRRQASARRSSKVRRATLAGRGGASLARGARQPSTAPRSARRSSLASRALGHPRGSPDPSALPHWGPCPNGTPRCARTGNEGRGVTTVRTHVAARTFSSPRPTMYHPTAPIGACPTVGRMSLVRVGQRGGCCGMPTAGSSPTKSRIRDATKLHTYSNSARELCQADQI